MPKKPVAKGFRDKRPRWRSIDHGAATPDGAPRPRNAAGKADETPKD